MSKYDRYVLSLLIVMFGFFALILVAVFWINRAVTLFDRLIGDGQTAWVFLEFTALSLPNLVRMVLPMAAFSAAVYVTNRLSSESELTVMQATGSSPWRMARPILAFGVLVALMMSVLTHLLMPASFDQLALREAEVSQNVTARLLSEGEFLHPTRGVTFYIRSISDDGTLNDVFLSDRRNPDQIVTYTAARAFLVRDGGSSLLIMVDGLAQRLSLSDSRLSTTNFADFSYDISVLVKTDRATRRNIRQIPTLELIRSGDALLDSDAITPGQVAEELHLRFARPLTCIAVALIGFSTLLVGGFSRFGVWRQIVYAFFALIGLEVLRGVMSEPVLDDPDLWPLIYVPAALGIALAALLLHISARPVRRRPMPPDPGEDEVPA